MSIIDDIFSKLEQKQKIQQITDSYQPENLEETLHDAIINRFKDIQENIELGFFHIQEAHEIINLDKIPSEKSYPSINLDIYSKILIEFAKKIDYITNSFEELKKISEEKTYKRKKA